MIVFKGDRVRTASGETGEVTETWGISRTFIRLLRDSDGKIVPMFEADVVEVTRNPASKKRGR
jgi:hypothetical protein